MKQVTTIRLEPELLEKLQTIANEQNRSLANVIETILLQGVDNYSQNYEKKDS